MGDTSNQRRLAAILAADVTGYTQLVERDTDGTVAAWKAARDDIIKPRVGEKSGRIIKFTGDGFLVEFASVQDAVNCAISMQKELSSNSLNFRMGVNVGDITDDGGDVHGEGVNIAARLEALAEPGGICISGDVYNQVRNRIEAEFKDMGEKQVKHVSRPVRVYAIDVTEQTASENPNLALPDKPSIAVLPFDNMSNDPEQEYFSDGISEDIITELARFQSLFVTARNSSFHYKGKSAKIRDVGRELGVQYVVEGSVRKAGNRVRITAQLIEAETENHIWAERYDRELEDIFTVQDEVVSSITMTVSGQVGNADRIKSERKAPSDIGAYDLVLRAHWITFNESNPQEAVLLLEQAIKIDPDYALAHAMLAEHAAWGVFIHGHDIEATKVVTQKHGETAARLAPGDAVVHAVLGESYGMVGEHELATYHVDKALSLNPNDYSVMLFAGWVRSIQGDHEDAGLLYERAKRNDPYSNIGLRENYIDMYYLAGRYQDCVDQLVGWPDSPPHVQVEVAAALAQLGRTNDARAIIERVTAEAPEGWDVANVARACQNMCARPEDGDRFIEGFKKAGIDV